MTESLQEAPAGEQPSTRAALFLTSQDAGPHDLKPLSVALELQSPAGLLAVLTTIARLGCQLTHVHAVGRQAALGVLAPLQVAHRVLPCLGQVVEVIAVAETGPEGMSWR